MLSTFVALRLLMNDIQRALYAPKEAPAAPAPPFADAAEMLADAGGDDVAYLAPLLSAMSTSLAVIAARMASDRTAFQKELEDVGVTSLAHRQLVCNSLARGVRLGRITKGWETPVEPPPECAHCGARAGPNKKLLVCARCKGVKYCGAGCQKKAWSAGHKEVCKRVSETPRPSFGAEPPPTNNALPPSFGHNDHISAHAAMVDAHKNRRVIRAVDGGFH